MRLMSLGLLAGFLVCGPAVAATANSQPPSSASIKELLQVGHAQQRLDTMQALVGKVMHKANERALAGRPADAGEQKILDAQTVKFSALMKTQMSWNALEPVYIDIYSKNFTQKEVDDMIAFYKSPSGQAMVTKMPAVMGQAMQTMQAKMAAMMPKIQQISEDTANQLKAYQASKRGSAAAAKAK